MKTKKVSMAIGGRSGGKSVADLDGCLRWWGCGDAGRSVADLVANHHGMAADLVVEVVAGNDGLRGES
jgi:hypothetical protein